MSDSKEPVENLSRIVAGKGKTKSNLLDPSLIAQHLTAIITSSDDAILSKTLDGTIQSWNASAERIYGYTAEEAIGKHISIIIPPDRIQEEADIVEKLKMGARVDHYETMRKTKEGRLIHISLSVSPIKDENGVLIGCSKVARDITERKNTEAELAEERETLATLNRLAPAIASNLDLESLVQLATDEATKVTGAKFGAFFYNVISEEGKALLLYTLSGAPREAFSHLGMPRATAIFGPTFRAEGTLLIDDVLVDPRYGHNKPHSGMPKGHLPVRSYLAVPVVSRHGEVIGGLFFGHPQPGVFTQRDAQVAEGIAALAAVGIDNARLYKQVYLGQKKAEAASRAKTDFLATMSHEIRTPMNAIVGLSSILGRSAPLTDKQAEYIKTLQLSADALLSLINDLLDISKIEARTIELEEVDFSLCELVHEIVSMMSVRAQEKGLEFTADCGTIEHMRFFGDPTRMRQIITNLCANSLKFTEKGFVSIRVLTKPGAAEDVLDVFLLVEDSGIGIHDDKKATIFEKFVQADNSISRKYGGSGLGLSITKQLVEVMGGTITVDSTYGRGSLFTVMVPLRVTEDSAEELAQLTRAPVKGGSMNKTVLLVEDHEANILVAATYLEDLGYDFDIARNGSEAIERSKSKRYQAILMDVQMPGMNGFEATQLIRAFEVKKKHPRVPIIGVTAHATTGDRERCLASGMDDYIAKPFHVVELETKLNKYSSSEKQ